MEQTYYVHKQTNRHNWIGLAGTTIFHAIILLSLYFFILIPPNPPWEEMGGSTISIGEENMGGPSETPVENPQPNETYTPIEAQPDQPELSQNTDPEVDVVAKEVPKKPTQKPTVEPPVESPNEKIELPQKAKSLFKRSTTAVNEQSGRGDGTVPGNEGDPNGQANGTPDGTGTGIGGTGSGTNGPGSGNGFSYSLLGRRIAKKPNISSNSKEVGIVVVNITVDRNGNVIKAEPGARGSTTLASEKLEKAKQAALSTKFSAKADGPEEQYGTMTVNFTFE